MGQAETGAGLHGHHGLDAHRQVDHHAVAHVEVQGLQRVGELADPVVQLLIGNLGDGAVVGFEDQRGLVAARCQMAVQAVVGNIEFAIGKPFVEGRGGFIQRLRKRLLPGQQFARLLGPEPFVILLGFFAKRMVSLNAAHRGLFKHIGAGLENAVFSQDGFDGTHGKASSGIVFIKIG